MVKVHFNITDIDINQFDFPYTLFRKNNPRVNSSQLSHRENLKAFNLIHPYSCTSPSEAQLQSQGFGFYLNTKSYYKRIYGFFYKPHDLPLKGEKRQNNYWERYWLSDEKLSIWEFLISCFTLWIEYDFIFPKSSLFSLDSIPINKFPVDTWKYLKF